MDQAKTVSVEQRDALIHAAGYGRHWLRNTAIVQFAFYQGLRACEISRITWSMVLDADGSLSSHIMLAQRATKMRTGERRLVIHPALRETLLEMMQHGVQPTDPIIRSQKGGAMSADSIVDLFMDLAEQCKLDGVSSHSGRRTFATTIARKGVSTFVLRDLLGHSFITTTQRYVDVAEADKDAAIMAL